MIERHQLNRRRWDELTPVHVASSFYDVAGFLNGNSSLWELERDAVGDVNGKRLLHLQCHFGLDTLSWARLGASVVGVDFSTESVAFAKELAARAGLGNRAEFVCCEVLELNQVLGEPFDVVYTSHGTVTWLSDIDAWGRVVATHLKPDGVFYICDDHPAGLLFEEDSGYPKLTHAYFHAETPIEIHHDRDYADQDYTVQTASQSWVWSLADILGALEKQGLGVHALREHPFNVYQQFPSMTQRADRYWQLPGEWPPIPLMFDCKARRASPGRVNSSATP